MAVLGFFAAITAASLAWTAVFAATAARANTARLKGLFIVIGIGLPFLAAIGSLYGWVMPWVWSGRIPPEWGVPAIAAAIVAAFGGVAVIARGAAPRHLPPPAARWPILTLAGGVAASAVLAGGCWGMIVQGIAAEGRALRLEVQRRMVELMPPLDPTVDNAAPLYTAFVAHVAADSRLNPPASDQPPSAAEVPADVLASHAATIDLLRRAAAIPACRFDRDWARPSIEQLLPEPQALRLGAGLLARTARDAAAEGRVVEALADVALAGRIGRHLRGESFLIIEKTARHIEEDALETLVAILPHVTPDQASSLDAPGLADLLAPPPRPGREFVVDESALLLLFAGTADGRATWLAGGGSIPVVPLRPADLWPACNELIYRTVFTRNEIAACRREFDRYRAIADAVGSHERDWPDAAAEIAMLGEEIAERPRDGMMLPLLMPAIGIDIRARLELEARREAARVLIAATRHRLATGRFPLRIEDLPRDLFAAIPRDPFGSGQPLRVAVGPDEIVVWSIGPDGLDGGGPGDDSAVPPAEPPPIGAAAPAPVDDIGFRLAARPPEPKTPAVQRPDGAD